MAYNFQKIFKTGKIIWKKNNYTYIVIEYVWS